MELPSVKKKFLLTLTFPSVLLNTEFIIVNSICFIDECCFSVVSGVKYWKVHVFNAPISEYSETKPGLFWILKRNEYCSAEFESKRQC